MHDFIEKTYSPAEISNLRCLDYGELPVHALHYGEVRRQGESVEHGSTLLESLKMGIREPISTFVVNGATYLADGHHRAVYAYENGLSLTALERICDCDTEGRMCPYVFAN